MLILVRYLSFSVGTVYLPLVANSFSSIEGITVFSLFLKETIVNFYQKILIYLSEILRHTITMIYLIDNGKKLEID